MQRKKIRKSFAIFLVALILCWSSLPSISMAFFIKPGKAIQPGEAITPGTPISGGQFIIPGDPINGGESYQPGSIYKGGTAPVSGQPIIPANHIKIGQFIIPNIAGNLPINRNWLVTGTAMTNGKAITPGNTVTGGNTPDGGASPSVGAGVEGGSGPSSGGPLNGGNTPGGGASPSVGVGVEGGSGPSSGGPLNGGNTPGGGTNPSGDVGAEGGNGPSSGGPLTGGNTADGGTNPSGGVGAEGGNGPSSGGPLNGGDTADGGTSPSGGAEGANGSSSGNLLTGGNSTNGGDSPTGGDATSGQTLIGEGINGNSGNSGAGTGNGNSNPASFVESAFTWVKNLKKVVLTVPNYLGEMLDGSLSMWAGFKITDLKTAKGKKNLYQVNGRATVINGNSKLATYLNMRYSAYLKSFENSKAVVKAAVNGSVAVTDRSGKKSTRNYAIFQPRNDSLLKQKRIQGFLDEVTSFKSVLNKTKSYMKKNWLPLEKGGINKDFFKSSTLAKGNGLANIVLSVGYRVSQNAADSSRTGTDLAAGITTDILLGAGQTAVSAGAGWSAVMIGSSFGSVVPGLGTVVGAVVGLGIALALSTNTGKRFSRKVESIVKSGIVKLKNSKIGKGLKGLFGG